MKTGTLNDFIKHESFSSSEIQAKLKLNESLGEIWCQVIITVRIASIEQSFGTILIEISPRFYQKAIEESYLYRDNAHSFNHPKKI